MLDLSRCSGNQSLNKKEKKTRLFCLWNSPGKNTEVGCYSFPQGIFLTRTESTSPALQADSLPPEPALERWKEGKKTTQQGRASGWAEPSNCERELFKWNTLTSLKNICGDFPEGPVVKTSISNAWGAGSVPGWGAKIPHVSQPKNQNIEQKQYCNKSNTDFKNCSRLKKRKHLCVHLHCVVSEVI